MLTAVRRHLVGRMPVSGLCGGLGGGQPTQIYQWKEMLYGNGVCAFAKPGRKARRDDANEIRIKALDSKIQLNIEVVGELLWEHVQLKKGLGSLNRSMGFSDTPSFAMPTVGLDAPRLL
ncbi:hypothetical protein Enr13x_30970 [Stieleria neptunia]|uniref:Transposase n=1 Tax=Stieleria neptunia TaxID=2527979 RepID=A0A518HQW4_9BACT|nr:transposase [Stieleria neptunia]QDV43242.1 hypothetical protein Enr13x_30970 [Stieleria neptunia]